MVRQGRHAIDASHVPTRYLLRSLFASRKLAPARSDAPGEAAGGATGGRGGGAGGAQASSNSAVRRASRSSPSI